MGKRPLRRGLRRTFVALSVVVVAGSALAHVAATPASAATQQLDLKVLVLGEGAADPTTSAWVSALESEGVAYTLVNGDGSSGSQTLDLPPLSSGSHGFYNAVVMAQSPFNYTFSAVSPVYSYEVAFGVRQLDGFFYPGTYGQENPQGGSLDGTTAQLTSAGLAAFPALAGPVPFDTGSFGYEADVTAGAPFTPLVVATSGKTLAGVYVHPNDAQPGVTELEVNFNYNANQRHWLQLAPSLIDWVTQNEHLGLARNYFGVDVDDTFLADNEWSSQFQCTPGAVNPSDPTCPPGVANNPADTPPDVHMSAGDVTHVVNWEQSTGLKLELAFNGVGACTAPNAGSQSHAVCDGATTIEGNTYTDPGQVIDPGSPAMGNSVDALLAHQADFNWINHTWAHAFLGCATFQPQVLTSVNPGAASGGLSSGTFHYEITAATTYGESEPSTPQAVDVVNGSADLVWPDATNAGGPTLSQLSHQFGGGSGFWGYNVYREDPWESSFFLVGQVAVDPSGATTTYSYSDVGATGEGASPSSSASFPTATNPAINCTDWVPATSGSPDSSIEQEIGLNAAFAAANGVTNYNPAAVVTGEHSGLENPNMAAAFTGTDVTVFGSDASRQLQPYTIAGAHAAPRYPSNIYYNASNWPDQINEYNTTYVAAGQPLGDPNYPSETGRCVGTPSTTCLLTPATKTSILASESHIALGHIMGNNARMSFAHQSNLIGPAPDGYTLLSLLDSVKSQYDTLFRVPLEQITDTTSATVLQNQQDWTAALGAGTVSATSTGDEMTVTNTGASAVAVPVAVPGGATLAHAPFGETYGASSSGWTTVGAGQTITFAVTTPQITSAAATTFTELSAGTFTVTATGDEPITFSETGALPSGVSLSAAGVLSGTPADGTAGDHPITIFATGNNGNAATQAFVLTVQAATGFRITTTVVPDGRVRTNYSVTLNATGGTLPYRWSHTGQLPNGVKLHKTGVLSGRPTRTGTFTFTAVVKDKSRPNRTATRMFTIHVTT